MNLYQIIDDPLGEVDRLITDDLIRKVDGPVYRIADLHPGPLEVTMRQLRKYIDAELLVEVGEDSTP